MVDHRPQLGRRAALRDEQRDIALAHPRDHDPRDFASDLQPADPAKVEFCSCVPVSDYAA